MPLYLGETRATTCRVMAALEAYVGWMLYGPRQHEADLLLSLGVVSPVSRSESTGKRS